jgi:xylulokinase
VGNGITREKLVSISVGTSGVVFAYSDRVFVDPLGRLHTFCHAVPGKWHLMGVMLSAGGSFRWLRDTFFSAEKEIAEKQNRQVYEDLIGMAQSVPVGSEGLIFLPYLTGERCPYPDPDAKGVFFGVSLKTTKAHFVRSVLEGVSFGLRDSLEIMKKIGLQTGGGCRVSGGGGRSPFWCQMLADIMNEKMVRLTTEEGPAYGAALLAGSGINLYPKIEQACDEFLKEKDVFLPEPAIVKKYAAIYPLYGKLYHDLKSSFDHLAKIS